VATDPDNCLDIEAVRSRVVAALKAVRDPELPVNIYELGLVYGIDIDADGDVHIRMTLTTPNCPVAGELPREVQAKAGAVEGVRDVKVDIVWEPPWTPDRMSEAAKLEMNLDDGIWPPDQKKNKFTKLGRLK